MKKDQNNCRIQPLAAIIFFQTKANVKSAKCTLFNCHYAGRNLDDMSYVT